MERARSASSMLIRWAAGASGLSCSSFADMAGLCGWGLFGCRYMTSGGVSFECLVADIYQQCEIFGFRLGFCSLSQTRLDLDGGLLFDDFVM